MIIIIMSKILCLNVVHLNTRYQRTIESNEKMFCNFCLLSYPTFISPRALEWVMWPHVTFQYVTWNPQFPPKCDLN